MVCGSVFCVEGIIYVNKNNIDHWLVIIVINHQIDQNMCPPSAIWRRLSGSWDASRMRGRVHESAIESGKSSIHWGDTGENGTWDLNDNIIRNLVKIYITHIYIYIIHIYYSIHIPYNLCIYMYTLQYIMHIPYNIYIYIIYTHQ